MEIAEEVVKELNRLKDVAKWKLLTRDASDDFSDKPMPAEGARTGQNSMIEISDASEAVAGSPTESLKSVASAVSSRISDAASVPSSAVLGEEQGTLESVASQVTEIVGDSAASTMKSLTSLASQAGANGESRISGPVFGSEEPLADKAGSSISSATSSIASRMKDKPMDDRAKSLLAAAKSKRDQASKSVSAAQPGSGSLAAKAAETLSRAASNAGSGINQVSASAESAATQASKKVMGGAMAQSVEAREPVFDDFIDDSDDTTYSERIQNLVSGAGAKYADITRAVSEAILKPTSTQGTVEQVTSLAIEQYESAIAAASSVLYGAKPGTGSR